MSLAEFINHLVPTSIVDGMARNEILQIVVFSVFFGVGCSAVGEKAKVLVDAIEGLSYVMLRVTMLVMWFAPIAVFAAAWIGLIVGHRIEGQEPSFLEGVRLLLVGPAWLLGRVYRRVGIAY